MLWFSGPRWLRLLTQLSEKLVHKPREHCFAVKQIKRLWDCVCCSVYLETLLYIVSSASLPRFVMSTCPTKVGLTCQFGRGAGRGWVLPFYPLSPLLISPWHVSANNKQLSRAGTVTLARVCVMSMIDSSRAREKMSGTSALIQQWHEDLIEKQPPHYTPIPNLWPILSVIFSMNNCLLIKKRI